MLDESLARLSDHMFRVLRDHDHSGLSADEVAEAAGSIVGGTNWYAPVTADEAADAWRAVLVVGILHATRAAALGESPGAVDEQGRAEAFLSRLPSIASLMVPERDGYGADPRDREMFTVLATPSPFRGPGAATRWVLESVGRFAVEGKLDDLLGTLGLADGWRETSGATTEAGASPPPDPDRADQLFVRAEDESDGLLLAQAINEYRRVCDATPPENPDRPGYLARLGKALCRQGCFSGPLDALEEAESVLREALAGAGPDSRHRVSVLTELGYTLLMRFEHQAVGAMLPESERLLREAVDLRPDDVDQSVRARTTLGQCLRRVYEQDRDSITLAELIDLYRRAVGENQSEAIRPYVLQSLAGALLLRFERNGDDADCRESVDLYEEALRGLPRQSSWRLEVTANLANTLFRAFERHGDPEMIEKAIALLREATAADRSGHPYWATLYAILGNCLMQRYQYSSDLRALDEGITASRTAIGLVSEGHHQRPTWLLGLGAALVLRYQTGHAGSLDEAIRTLRQAWDSADPTFWNRDSIANTLASALSIQAARQRNPELANEGTNLLQKLVDRTEPDHPRRPIRLNNLALSLKYRAETFGSSWDLKSAERAAEEARRELSPQHPALAQILPTLGGIQALRSRLTGDAGLWRAACGCFRAAAGLVTAPTARRVEAAVFWGREAVERHDYATATEAFGAAVRLVDQLAWRGLDRANRERLLDNIAGLATDAAACAVQTGQPELAIELLEQGRGVLIAQSVESRNTYRELRRRAPELADQFTTVRQMLDQPIPETDDPVRQADQRINLAHRRDELLRRIRQLDRMGDFLEPPPMTKLRLAAAQGRVVVLNVSPIRCDALIVTMDGVDLCPLPDLTAADVTAQVTALLAATDSLGHDEPDVDDDGPKATFDAVLDWAWRVIAAPVLQSMGYHHAPDNGSDWPRVWWCPTGLLTFVPWHAAGSVLDRVVSSYTPTLLSLINAWERPRPTTQPPTALAVVMARTPGHNDLPAAEREVDSLRVSAPQTTVLDGPRATRDAVLKALGTVSWAHFACHGMQDLSAPSRGHLVMHDDSLGIEEISRLRLGAAELAVLSACETSRGGTVLVDEAITMAGAMQLAGFRHVVGTLWATGDYGAAKVIKRFYEHLSDPQLDARHAAIALHHSLRKLRRTARHPKVWAAFIHIGP